MLLSLVITLALPPIGDEDAKLRERFDQEFPAAVARNRDFYSRMSGSGRISWMSLLPYSSSVEEGKKAIEEARKAAPGGVLRASSDQSGGVLARAESFSFALQGPLKKIKLTTILKTVAQAETGARVLAAKDDTRPGRVQDPYAVARCVGRDGSFHVVWLAEGAAATLVNYRPGQDAATASRIETDFANDIRCVYKPYNMKDETFIANPSLKVKSVTPRVKDGLNLAHVEFTVEYPNEPPGRIADLYSSGWFDAIPDQGWVIREGIQGSANRPESTAFKVDYEGSQDGFPLPKRVTIYSALARRIVEFDQIRHGTVPESEFTPAAFGLSEIDQKPAPR